MTGEMIMTIITSDFDIRQKVYIKALDLYGYVIEIKLASPRPEEYTVNVEYWWEGQIRSVWLYPDEVKIP